MTVVIPDPLVPAVYTAGVACGVLFLLYAVLYWPATPRALLTDYPPVAALLATAVAAGWGYFAADVAALPPEAEGRWPGRLILGCCGLVAASVYACVMCLFHTVTMLDRIDSKD